MEASIYAFLFLGAFLAVGYYYWVHGNGLPKAESHATRYLQKKIDEEIGRKIPSRLFSYLIIDCLEKAKEECPGEFDMKQQKVLESQIDLKILCLVQWISDQKDDDIFQGEEFLVQQLKKHL